MFKGKTKHKMSRWDWAFVICNTIFLILFCIVTLYPVLNTLAYSFTDSSEAILKNIHLIPRKPTLAAYKQVFEMKGFQRGLIITVSRTVLGSFLSLFANALLAFIVSRKNFLFKKSLSLFWVITMYASGGLIPSVILMRYLHLTGTFWVYIFPGLVSAFNLLVLRTYMNSLPDSYEESAQLDGAGHLTVFTRIISPLCKPVYATVFLFVAVGHWNSWFDAMVYNRLKEKNTTLQYELQKLLSSLTQLNPTTTSEGKTENMTTEIQVRAAATIATMLPIICLYPFLQRYFVTGLTIGGVKE
ncbi:MAG: carbohydrate ABC transporter permease [Clostridiales bacterium]|nr:carbohydrate ABC transporter permease [Clostridiales bacterium]MBP5417597.1 carbohydrate ABC transporter permease [Clostridiales bacterium]